MLNGSIYHRAKLVPSGIENMQVVNGCQFARVL